MKYFFIFYGEIVFFYWFFVCLFVCICPRFLLRYKTKETFLSTSQGALFNYENISVFSYSPTLPKGI